MVIGMASKKVTVTIPDHHVTAIRELVASGHARSVSGFVQHAIEVAVDDAAGWRQVLDEGLERTGGPLTDSERAWADEVLRGAAHPAA